MVVGHVSDLARLFGRLMRLLNSVGTIVTRLTARKKPYLEVCRVLRWNFRLDTGYRGLSPTVLTIRPEGSMQTSHGTPSLTGWSLPGI